MKEYFIGGLLILGVFLLGIGAFYFREGFINPERERMRRNTWEQTHSFNAGKRQELAKYMVDHAKADDDGKGAIESAVRLIVADLPLTAIEQMPPELRTFLRKCNAL